MYLLTVVPKKGIGKHMSEPIFQSEATVRSLVEKAQEKDDLAFQELLTAFKPMLKSQVHSFTSGNPALDADDLHQEASLCFWRAVISFDPAKTAGTFGGFAKTCVHNGLIDHLRKNQIAPEFTEVVEDGLPDDVLEPGPSTTLVEIESYLELCKKVQAQLSDHESTIWWLYFEGRTSKEIAKMVGKDEKSVSNSIYRIRQKLRKAIPNP